MSETINVVDDTITVPKWKLVCLLKALLKPGDPDASRKKSHKHKRSGEWAGKCSRRAVESFQKPHALGWENDPFHAMSYMARVLNMSTQLATTHRWDGNAKLFSALARQISHCPVVIWKVGAQCLSNHPDGRDDLLRSFAKTMVQVGRAAAPEILFDYTTHLISIGEYQEAKQFLEEYKGKCGHKVAHDVRVILQGFRGMLEYIEWFQKKNAKDNDDIPGNQLAIIGTETEIAVHADRAIVHFNNFAGCQENCDSFISILIEILEYYNRVDELEKVLQSYLQFNEIHPSPCVFMYDFLMKHYPTDVERRSYILEELARICPSHPYILTLCKLISEQEFVKSVQHLACLVDYEEWRSDLQVWKQMALTLITSAINCKDKSQYHTLHTLWTDRSMWWPAYHFRLEDISVHDQASAELVMYKSIVIATMFNSEHTYIMMVKEMLEVGKWENELTFLIMKLEIADHLNQQVKSKLAEKCRNPAFMQQILPPQEMRIERLLQQQIGDPMQYKMGSTLTAEKSKKLLKQAIVQSMHNKWKVSKKSKISTTEQTQGRNEVQKLVIKKRTKLKGKPLNRRGRPVAVNNGVRPASASSSSSSTSSSSAESNTSSSDEGALRHLPPSKNLTGITSQPLVQQSQQTKVLSTTNGTVLKNQSIRRARAMPPGFSKPFVSSSDSDSDSNADDLPLSNVRGATTVNTPVRTTVPLKRKSNAASDKASLLTNKKSHPTQTLSNKVQNFSPTRTWFWRKTVSDKMTQNLVKNISAKKDKLPKETLENVPAPLKTREADLAPSEALETEGQAMSNNQNLTRRKTAPSSSATSSIKHITKRVDVSSKETPGNHSESSKTQRTDQAPKSTTHASNIPPVEQLMHHSSEMNNRSLKAEPISPLTTDSEIEENVGQTVHTMEWKGKSLTLRAPVKLKNVSIVLERIKMKNI